jgi:hypothetical protein
MQCAFKKYMFLHFSFLYLYQFAIIKGLTIHAKQSLRRLIIGAPGRGAVSADHEVGDLDGAAGTLDAIHDRTHFI